MERGRGICYTSGAGRGVFFREDGGGFLTGSRCSIWWSTEGSARVHPRGALAVWLWAGSHTSLSLSGQLAKWWRAVKTAGTPVSSLGCRITLVNCR